MQSLVVSQEHFKNEFVLSSACSKVFLALGPDSSGGHILDDLKYNFTTVQWPSRIEYCKMLAGVESLRRHCIGESVQEKPPAEDSWTDLIFVCFESSRAGSSQSCSSRSSSEEKAPGNKSIGSDTPR